MDKSKKGSSGGLTKHIDRKGKISENVNQELTKYNLELVKTNGTIDEMANRRIKEGYKGKKAPRKDAITTQRYMLSGSSKEMNALNDIQLKQWAVDNYRFFSEMYGEKNIIRATVHLDETTPHMHLIVVPLTKDGRLSAKEFTGTREKLANLQNDYSDKVGKKYNLQRGISGKKTKHISTERFYKTIEKAKLSAEKIINAPAEQKDKIIYMLTEQLAIKNHTKDRENELRRYRERTEQARKEQERHEQRRR